MGKRIKKNEKDAMLDGVCAGIADYLNIDPTWVRFVFLMLAFTTSYPIFIIYFILVLILPED